MKYVSETINQNHSRRERKLEWWAKEMQQEVQFCNNNNNTKYKYEKTNKLMQNDTETWASNVIWYIVLPSLQKLYNKLHS